MARRQHPPLPQCLLDFVARELPSVRDVRIRACDRLPVVDRVPFFRADGITLLRTIYLRAELCPLDACDRDDMELLFHELVHVEQQARWPAGTFYPAYLAGHVVGVGYRNNPFERAARDRAAELTARYFREDPCGCGATPARSA